MTVHAYLFYGDGFAKVGHTRDLGGRLFQILHGVRPLYMPEVRTGGFLATHAFDTFVDARTTETMCQDLLHDHRVSKHTRGGRCEWFQVAQEVALRAFHQSCVSETFVIEVSRAQRDKLLRLKRRRKLASVGAVVRQVISGNLDGV